MKHIFLSFLLVLFSLVEVLGQKKDTVPTMVPHRITQKAPDPISRKEGLPDDPDAPEAKVKDSISYGFQTGFEVSNVIGSSIGDFSDIQFKTTSKAGFNLGFYIDLPITHGVFFQPEINYSDKGYNASGVNGSSIVGNFTPIKYRRTYQMIDVPLLIKYYPAKSLFFTAGPQISYLVLVNDQYNSPTTPESFAVYNRQLKQLRSFTAGINMGVGIKAGEKICFSATYAFDLVTNYKEISQDTPKFRNGFFALRVGYRLSKNIKK